jgi:hypothetical protein
MNAHECMIFWLVNDKCPSVTQVPKSKVIVFMEGIHSFTSAMIQYKKSVHDFVSETMNVCCEERPAL